MKHKTRITSLLAYADVLEKLGERQEQVYRELRRLPASNKMLSVALGLDINRITPRVLELRKMGVVLEYKKEKCEFTGRLVSIWQVRRKL